VGDAVGANQLLVPLGKESSHPQVVTSHTRPNDNHRLLGCSIENDTSEIPPQGIQVFHWTSLQTV
jgi:hypothetical protein